jgi:hypothetical protein
MPRLEGGGRPGMGHWDTFMSHYLAPRKGVSSGK